MKNPPPVPWIQGVAVVDFLQDTILMILMKLQVSGIGPVKKAATAE
jgi:hypothetical protein